MPVLFVGHGSPMNALADNPFSEYLRRLGQTLPRPRAIACLSAHWETSRTQILSSEQPKTIHDFGGFPKALYEIQYPAPGAPKVAARALELLKSTVRPKLSEDWGLDHGTWSVLLHMYPRADIPVFQISLDWHKTFVEHLGTGKLLAPLRDEGVLILGSGNIVHNLLRFSTDPEATPFDWALRFDSLVASALREGRNLDLAHFETLDPLSAAPSHPTPDHYIPLLYTAGASDPQDRLSFPFEGIQNASLSMRSVLWSPV